MRKISARREAAATEAGIGKGALDQDNPLVAIGKIVKARGIRGELVVAPLTDFPERFESMRSVLIEQAADGKVVECEITSLRYNNTQILLQLRGFETRNDAESLVGSFLCVRKDEMVKLPEDNYYQFELVGMEVVSGSGELLGSLAEIMAFPANDVWRVEGKTEILLPAIKSVVKRVDRENRRITVELIPGLIPEKAARRNPDNK